MQQLLAVWLSHHPLLPPPPFTTSHHYHAPHSPHHHHHHHHLSHCHHYHHHHTSAIATTTATANLYHFNPLPSCPFVQSNILPSSTFTSTRNTQYQLCCVLLQVTTRLLWPLCRQRLHRKRCCCVIVRFRESTCVQLFKGIWPTRGSSPRIMPLAPPLHPAGPGTP